MLHRSCSLLKILQSNGNDCLKRQICVCHIRLNKRHLSTVDRQKFLHVTPNSSNVNHYECPSAKWVCTTSGPKSTKSKTEKDDKADQNKTEQKPDSGITQRVVELKTESLGKLKERVLSVDAKKNNTQNSNKEKSVILLKEKVKKVEKKIPVDDAALKKQALPKKRIRVDLSASSLERNFITPIRAMSDFLLKQADLESLPKTKRRSPYEFEPPITVYWRRDVEAKALEKWGSKEALIKELLKKELERRTYQQNVFTVKKRLRDYRREVGSQSQSVEKEGLFGRSGKVVLTAIVINGGNFLFKLYAWIATGSHSMFSECIHSAADTINQLILAYGIHKSVQTPDPDHPYGYTNMKYVSSLISGVGIFCVGTGLSVYHGIHGILFPVPVESFYWAYCILAGSLLSEGATLLVAINSIKKGAHEKRLSFREYVMNGHDPSVNVVLMEDFAAVLGVMCAGCCMGLTTYLHNPVFDAIGSLLVGGLLGSVASFIIHTNVAALVGQSIPQENLDKINAELEADIMVRAIHDVKGIDMGNSLVRYKAEIDFDGRELTRSYLDKHDLNAMLEEVKKMENIDELESFLLKHGENIVDTLGGEIDRIELKLKKQHPEIRHCDLEIL
ncbi:hypothetical protein QAD02_015403 [Eretmocerus hayati]|uniref:Uncharacterized protein n=1 Tax=Eretmocerus hayati TaxID=131215 RepID=A0ACC2P9U2_9HYME|nr:hypothetical protein QAD02_015403 [Eretmocerus hayati]